MIFGKRGLAAAALAALLVAPAALASIPSAADLALARPALPELAPTSIEATADPESCGVFCQRLDVRLEAGLFGGGEPDLLALDAWGNYRNPQELEASKNRFGFTGHLFDRETGTYYAKARYFDPELGRFLSQDSFTGFDDEPTSLHGYTYVENRPTYFTDPDGNVAVVDNVVGGVVSVGIGYAATCFFKGCDQYSWADAGVDFGLGFASSGLSSLKYLKYAKDASKAANAARLGGRAGAQYAVGLAAEVTRHEIKEEEYSLAEVSQGAVVGAIFGEAAGAVARGVGRGSRIAAQRLAQSESRAAQFLARDITSFSAVQGAQSFGRSLYVAGQGFVTDVVSPGSRGWAGQRGMALNELLTDGLTFGHSDDLAALGARLRGALGRSPSPGDADFIGPLEFIGPPALHNAGTVSGVRQPGAFRGLRVTGSTPGGLNRASALWRARYGPAAARRHHLGPQELLNDAAFRAQMRRLGFTTRAEMRDYIDRQLADIPNALHAQLHAEGWNATWKVWLRQFPEFSLVDMQAQIASMVREFRVPISSRGGPRYR